MRKFQELKVGTSLFNDLYSKFIQFAKDFEYTLKIRI